MNSSSKFRFVVLCVLDGWGLAPPHPGNAISLANTPNMKKFWSSYPRTRLQASGEAVGLPKGEDGNTETGHINLGAGRIVYQDLERINKSIADSSFFKNEVLAGAISHAKKHRSKLHLLGLIGAGGVHSNIDHILALIHMASEQKFMDVYLHIFTDGRDSPPTAAKTYIKQIRDALQKENVGKVASIMGRYWAMDRDRRWDRTQKAYEALTEGAGHLVKTPEEAIDMSYSDGRTDEFVEPSLIADSEGKPLALISDNDAVVFYNFRVDRPRQLTKAFVFKDFKNAEISEFDPYQIDYEKTHISGIHKNHDIITRPSGNEPFPRKKLLENLYFVTMTEYSKTISEEGAKVAFPPEKVLTPLSAAISSHSEAQLKITESEKERFVTFYFNGLEEKPFEGEDRIIISSPLVSTYDQKPEMSSAEVTDTLLERLQGFQYRFVLVNFPGPDMVGHTGNIGPAVKAVEVVDECLGKISSFVLAYDGALLITADHGNVEEMINTQTGEIDTEHSTNTVPFIAVSRFFLGKQVPLPQGILADVAPTVLGLLEITPPDTMSGRNLLGEVLRNI